MHRHAPERDTPFQEYKGAAEKRCLIFIWTEASSNGGIRYQTALFFIILPPKEGKTSFGNEMH